ncbi:MAG: hypothetical protein PXX73_10175 [Sideroxydans sp.]|nr:hypothetical protein [Sideroxydans sp.]
MIFKKTRRKFSMDATQLSIRPHVAWYVRWGMRIPFVIIAVAASWWAYDYGLQLAGFHRGKSEQELTQLHEQVDTLTADNVQLSRKVAEYEQQLQIDHASGQETGKQLKNLGDENARLQEDLSFFQNLTASTGKEGELAMHRLKLERDSVAGEFHLKMLLVQSGQRAKQFVGNLQVVANFVQNGQKATIVFPSASTAASDFKLNFKYYHRVDQVLHIPADAKLENMQVRVFEQNASEPKIRQNVEPS